MFILVKRFLLKVVPLTSLNFIKRRWLQVELMSVREEQEIDNLEEEVFKALDHQIRRNVLRYIGESKQVSFTEVLNTVNIPTVLPSSSYTVIEDIIKAFPRLNSTITSTAIYLPLVCFNSLNVNPNIVCI